MSPVTRAAENRSSHFRRHALQTDSVKEVAEESASTFKVKGDLGTHVALPRPLTSEDEDTGQVTG